MRKGGKGEKLTENKKARQNKDNKHRQLLNRGLVALKKAKAHTDDPRTPPAHVLHAGVLGRSKRSACEQKVPHGKLTCERGKKGKHAFLWVLRSSLWEWFVDIRAAVLTRIWPHFMLLQARHMAGTLLKEMAAVGQFVKVPHIDARWLRHFLAEYRIVLRQPNRRYKVSRKIGDERCLAELVNCFKVRCLAEHYLGNDLSTKMMQVDEKPIHVNESGSKAVKTLEHQGAPAVSLRTNHSATRERFTMMTSAFSSIGKAMADRRPPLAVCIKAQGTDLGKKVTLPELQW